MTKKLLFSIVFIAIVLTMTSCFPGTDPEVEFEETDLLGLWQEDGTEAFVRFTDEQDKTGEYKYGREWNESEDIFESNLQPYGNGWFKYKLVKSDLTEIHLMDNGGADIPKIYQVVKLNAGELHYKDNLGKIYYFSKILVH